MVPTKHFFRRKVGNTMNCGMRRHSIMSVPRPGRIKKYPLHPKESCAIIRFIKSDDEAAAAGILQRAGSHHPPALCRIPAAAGILQRAGGWCEPEENCAFPLPSCRVMPEGGSLYPA